MWFDDSPRTKFLKELVHQRATRFAHNGPFLRDLRHRPEEARNLQRVYGKVWESQGTNVFKLIASACGETWDLEDEEKHARAPEKKEVAIKQRDDDLVATREEGTCRREHELQGVAEEGERVLEEEQGRLGGDEGEGALKGALKGAGPEEEKEKVRRLRGERFYRSAGAR